MYITIHMYPTNHVSTKSRYELALILTVVQKELDWTIGLVGRRTPQLVTLPVQFEQKIGLVYLYSFPKLNES
jgi:hypothetical protein